MKDIQKTIAIVLAITAVASLFFFVLIFILFDFLKVETPLKDSWETFGGYFGGITTLVTACIASLLFNDWKDIERFKRANEMLDKISVEASIIHKDLTDLVIKSRMSTTPSDYRKESSQVIRHKIHMLVTYIALDHEKLFKSNPYIKNYFDITNNLIGDYSRYRKALKQDIKANNGYQLSNKLLENCLEILVVFPKVC